MQRIPPRLIQSDDAEIVYRVLGDGPPLVLLHPFPVTHEFWMPVAEALATRYRVVLPDLRGHGDSGIGEGPATMEKHAADIARVMDDAEVGPASLVGVSIGGYALFEFWRKHRGRVAALGLCNTEAQADGAEARAGRLQAANDVLDRGTEPFFESLIPRVLAKTTREMRPDLVDGAMRMMRKLSAEDVAQLQRGLAFRSDGRSRWSGALPRGQAVGRLQLCARSQGQRSHGSRRFDHRKHRDASPILAGTGNPGARYSATVRP